VAAPRLTRDEKKAQTRQRLLDAAAVVFARKGLGAASLDEIAAEAGLTKGAVYSNFANKEELVLAVLDQRSHERSRATIDHVDLSGDARVEARRAGDLFVQMEKQEAWLIQLWLEALSYATRNPEFGSRMAAGQRTALTDMAEIIELTVKEFDVALPMPPFEMAVFFNALVNGLIIETMLNPDIVPDDFLGRAIAMVFDAAASE